MKAQKTYNGKTAGGYLRGAQIVEDGTGGYIVGIVTNGWITQYLLTEYGNLAIHDHSGLRMILLTSNRAEDALRKLTARADRMTADKFRI